MSVASSTDIFLELMKNSRVRNALRVLKEVDSKVATNVGASVAPSVGATSALATQLLKSSEILNAS